jgi:hypothetical protein
MVFYSEPVSDEESGSASSGSIFDEAFPRAPRSTSRNFSKSVMNNSSLLRLAILQGVRQDSSIHKLLGLVSKYGEVQSIDMSRFQFDSTFTVSYFDIRAATFARSSISDGSLPNIRLANLRDRCNSFIEHLEEAPHSCSISGRCVDVTGFPTWDIRYKDVLLSIFTKFGEIESITHNSTDEYRIAFFDSRSPLAIQGVLHPDCIHTESIKVSSEDIVPLLLAGANIETVSGESQSPESSEPSIAPRKTANEFAIDVLKLEKGEEKRTTVMIRNIPRSFTQNTLISLINKRFELTQNQLVFDFLYLPIDLANRVNVGYVFINFTKPEHVIQCLRFFNSKTWRNIVDVAGVPLLGCEELSKVARVTFARLQGKDCLMEHFSKSSIMNNQPASIRPFFR